MAEQIYDESSYNNSWSQSVNIRKVIYIYMCIHMYNKNNQMQSHANCIIFNRTKIHWKYYKYKYFWQSFITEQSIVFIYSSVI